jgi:hypothetical protein
VKFKAGTLEFNATVAEASEAPSPQTGDNLRSLTIQFRAQKVTMHEQALEEAQQRQAGGLFSLGEGDQPEIEWRVREFTSQYVGTEPWGINHHIWRIEQVERLACERLIIGPIEVEPYDYAEEASDDGVVRVAARGLTSSADLETLSRISDAPVTVVRVGISDSPRQMSLRYVWGERPEGLAVVVACEDIHEPRVSLRGGTAEPDGLHDLVAVLQAKGVLGGHDLQELRQRRHAGRRVVNVDGWPL